ncbi:Tob1-like protein, partial [Euroglyphus maynei]
MHDEIEVALNFLISFLYNKLPRRRVNQFGEELELIVRNRFDDHWYPDEPSKGSAYRCIHCNPQLDSSLFREAALKSGLNLQDVQQNFPTELSIWIDPGEVSYRISEKGPVNILYSVKREQTQNGLNPEAQCFQPESLCMESKFLNNQQPQVNNKPVPDAFNHNNKNEAVTFTTAAFAATKFGSTKPKVSMMNKKQFQQTRTSPTDGPKFISQPTRKLHFKPVSRANSFNGNNGQLSHCQPPSIQSNGGDLLNALNNLAVANNRYNGHSQQIVNNQQQKMRQLMQWNSDIKSGFDRDQQYML